ncbi:topoisomerase DNA-binding C4 zinc finger domain-containing protein [Sphingopyxis flava]|uniref:topoisomerase DNA-binding C4 zinc finger domain-containing protein n=1 Tax=Sphingopyxis flava TaxID=1507287 RepID=UPI0009A5765A
MIRLQGHFLPSGKSGLKVIVLREKSYRAVRQARPVLRKAILAMPAVTVHYDRQRDGEESAILCPVEGCDGQLVEKSGRFGSFLGCSNFPRCRHSRNTGN